MFEYCYLDGVLEVRKDDNIIGMESEPEYGELYDYCLDGLYVYLKERDDLKAKSIIINYFNKQIDEVSAAEVEVIK